MGVWSNTMREIKLWKEINLKKALFNISPNIKTSFEEKFSKYIGTKYSILTPSGITALKLILEAINPKKDQEVILSPLICKSVPNMIKRFCKIRYVDIDETYNIDPNKISKNINSKTIAVFACHLYGNPARMDKISKICKNKKLYLIEDAAQALGAEFKSKKTGSFGDLSFFSLRKSLPFDTGGVITTNKKEFYEKINESMSSKSCLKIFEDFRSMKYFLLFLPNSFLATGLIGYRTLKKISNFEINKKEISNICASIALNLINKIDEFNNKRIKLCSNLPNKPKSYKNSKNIFTRYPVLIEKNIEKILMVLKKNGFYNGMRYLPDSNLKNVKNFSKKIVPINVMPNLNKEDINKLNKILKGSIK